MKKTARIVRFYSQGPADVLKVEDLPLQEPGEVEVRLKVQAIGLNRAEIMFRQGPYLETPVFPSRLGYEATGIVDAVGPGVQGVKINDRVSIIPSFSMSKYGVYGESAIVPAYAVADYPNNLTPSEGAAIWMQYITAYGALIELGKMKQGDQILITAASSSVGRAAIQIAKAAGATVIAATRTARKKQALLDGGANHVVVIGTEDLSKQVMEITNNKGASIIFDPVAGEMLESLINAAAPGATLFEYGVLAPAAGCLPMLTLMAKGLCIRGYTMLEIVTHPERLTRCKNYIYNGLQSGSLRPVIDRTFTFDQIAEAHRYMESNQQNGKIIVTI